MTLYFLKKKICSLKEDMKSMGKRHVINLSIKIPQSSDPSEIKGILSPINVYIISKPPQRRVIIKSDTSQSEYTVIKQIGEGGFGKILLVKDEKEHEWVIKVQDTKFFGFLAQKEKTVGFIKNPNAYFSKETWKVFQIQCEENRPHFEYGLQALLRLKPIFHGVDMDKKSYIFMPKADPIPDKLSKQHLIDLLEDLKSLHDVGISHNDIKSENVLIYEGKLSLIDVGVATSAEMDSRVGESIKIYVNNARQRDLLCVINLFKNQFRELGVDTDLTEEDLFMKTLSILEGNICSNTRYTVNHALSYLRVREV